MGCAITGCGNGGEHAHNKKDEDAPMQALIGFVAKIPQEAQAAREFSRGIEDILRQLRTRDAMLIRLRELRGVHDELQGLRIGKGGELHNAHFQVGD